MPNKCSLENKTCNSGTNRRSLTLFFLLFTLIFLTAYSLQLTATIRYVSKTGLSIPPYTSWLNAADSIQKCINICVFGDTIYVANGVYEEQVVMIPGLALIGTGSDSTIINTQAIVNSNGFVAVEVKDSCLFKGFQIIVYYTSEMGYGIVQNGNSLVEYNKIINAIRGSYIGYSGTTIPINNANIYYEVVFGLDIFNSNTLIKNNIIYTTTNTQLSTRGIFISAFTNDYTPTIDSNYIEAHHGVGIYKFLGSRPTIKNNVIKFSQYGAEAIYLMNSNVGYVFNNLIINETGQGGIYDNSITYTQIYHNYIIGNLGAYGVRSGPNDVVKNNIITHSNNGINTWNNQNLIVKYNDAWNNLINYFGFTLDTTNLSVDPMIVNDDSTQGNLNLHLQTFSPLIDAGDPNILDKDGTRSDIGLYGGPYGESYIYVDLPPRPPVNLTANIDSLIKLNWNRNTEADFSYYNVYGDTTFDFTLDSTKLIASVTDTFFYQSLPSNVETLYYKLTAVDNQGNESSPSEQVYVKIVSVKNEWMPVNNYILYQNFPNPFNPSTKIGYKLKERGYVKLYVYDIKGELVSILVNEVQEAGYYEIDFSVGQEFIPVLSSGVYIYQIFVIGDNNILVFSDIKKMLLVK